MLEPYCEALAVCSNCDLDVKLPVQPQAPDGEWVGRVRMLMCDAGPDDKDEVIAIIRSLLLAQASKHQEDRRMAVRKVVEAVGDIDLSDLFTPEGAWNRAYTAARAAADEASK